MDNKYCPLSERSNKPRFKYTVLIFWLVAVLFCLVFWGVSVYVGYSLYSLLGEIK
ncbi:hypothetical protein [Raoultella sp. C349492]|uniref:hypothetical protein n=1 Tax=Raoultella sp. C349492 TaxID=2970253 RepID=UPI0035C6FCE8